MDAAGVERFALLGISQGCSVSIAYAVRHPERVSQLVLYGGFAQGINRRAAPESQKEAFAAMLTLTRLGWGQVVLERNGLVCSSGATASAG